MMQAVIFDMDGLLVDTEPLWEKAEDAFLGLHQRKFSHENAVKTTGLRLDELIPAMKKLYNFEGENSTLGREIISCLKNQFRSGIPALQGAEDAISRFCAGFPVALASGSSLEIIHYVLSQFGWQNHFKAVCSADEVKAGKPKPDVFLLAAARLGVDPSLCVAVEDSVNGARAARAAGMKCVAIPCETRFSPADFHGIADAILPSLDEMTVDLVRNL